MQKKREELLGFVDYQDVGTVEEHLELVEDPYLNRYAKPERPKVMISERKEDQQYPSLHEALRGDETITQVITKLGTAVRTKLRYPTRVGLDPIYEMYAALPEPRMIHMPAGLRHRLLRVFGTPKKKETQTMLRYFSLLGDVKDCGIPLRRNEWNHALALASRYVGKTSDTEAESALQLWKEMEKQSGVRGNSVTFNILFDAASKSGNFPLAEMLWKEMSARKIPFNRYHRVSLIHFFGLQEDPDGVRAAYKEMVDAGEMIDTVVLNCVISSFLRCGEDEAALKVYNYMKGNYSEAVSLPQNDYFKDKVVTKVLSMFAEVGRKVPALRPQLQSIAGSTPDMRTYRTLINHFGIRRGDLGRVAQFLDEMMWFEVPVHGSIFLALFESFTKNGGTAFSGWTKARLENVLSALLLALDNKVQGLYLDTWLMMWALRAFMKCTNNDRVLEVYGEFRKRWELAPDRAQFMDSYTARLLEGKSSVLSKQFVPRQQQQQQKPEASRKRPLYVKHP
ncbi:pentatricopeptide repeat-containing protein At5g41170, mitochondrial [Colletotrichum spaethianum]|uniref:Pentatricopeptide repeat-containing protein At5g41170, mitochondrial n=1 Tax=Colletotrichum spaethianum TaxID=700344 RepID=A0AA37P182_9PEZI|nr:pentatricopeptide repeat-containing protein At5g41170, mitochondrial [Colletotrichum spaethianum]GKT44588.1 pentatricopeptide repeat-containing protein At5g41170, mitochondrial [Colletotrichum spaethianum]